MKTSLRTALVAALFATGSAFAGSSTDSTSVRIISNGSSETIEVPLSELKVGESRQLAAASGTPAIVTRTAGGLTIEMAGRSTEVRLPDFERIAIADADGSRHVKIIRHDGAHAVDADADGHRVRMFKIEGDDVVAGEGGSEHKVFVKRLAIDGEPVGVDDAELDALLADIDVDGVGDAKVIVVKRRKTDRTD
jgi:hypothetical protein